MVVEFGQRVLEHINWVHLLICSYFIHRIARVASQESLDKHFFPSMKHVGFVFIGILMQGVSAKAIRVRSYWRRRNGRKEFVRAHYRKR